MRNPIDSAALPPASATTASPHVDLATIKRRARENAQKGAVTATYAADRERVLEMLDAALATEVVCVLRYRRHYYAAQGMVSRSVAAEFLEHSKEEQEHADRIAARITQLGGVPNLDPDQLTARSHADYRECSTLQEMIDENLVAERIAIESYRQMIQEIGDRDPTTRRLLESILETEEEHAEELATLLAR